MCESTAKTKRRSDKDYIFSASKEALFCSVDDVVSSALLVCNNDPTEAIRWLEQYDSMDTADPFNQAVYARLEQMKINQK
tara:strand:- start:11599 stop:11838 length:240 start_codon:yes stop_codon:yes gene_type:complete